MFSSEKWSCIFSSHILRILIFLSLLEAVLTTELSLEDDVMTDVQCPDEQNCQIDGTGEQISRLSEYYKSNCLDAPDETWEEHKNLYLKEWLPTDMYKTHVQVRQVGEERIYTTRFQGNDKFEVVCMPGFQIGEKINSPRPCAEDNTMCRNINVSVNPLKIIGKSNNLCHCTILYTVKGTSTQYKVSYQKPYANYDQFPKVDSLPLFSEYIVMKKMPKLGYGVSYEPFKCTIEIASPCKGFVPIARSVVIQYNEWIMYSLVATMNLNICPAYRQYTMALHIEPETKPCSPPCPELGYVDFIYPFPFNNINYYEMRNPAWRSVQMIGYYTDLPLHIRQYLMPNVTYKITQMLMGTLLPNKTSTERLEPFKVITTTFTYTGQQPIGDKCIHEMEFLKENTEAQQRSCPPGIVYDTSEHGLFNKNGTIEIEVRGVMWSFQFCIDTEAMDNQVMSIKCNSFNFNGQTMYYSNKKKVTMLLKRDSFTFYPYTIKLEKVKSRNIYVSLLTMGDHLLIRQRFLIPYANNNQEIKLIRFGIPGMCNGAIQSHEDMEGVKQPTIIKLITDKQCSQDRCLLYSTTPVLSEEIDGKYPWLINLQPYFSSMVAIPVYQHDDGYQLKGRAKTTLFSEIMRRLTYKSKNGIVNLMKGHDVEAKMKAYSRAFSTWIMKESTKICTFIYLYRNPFSEEWALTDLRMPLNRVLKNVAFVDSVTEPMDTKILNSKQMPVGRTKITAEPTIHQYFINKQCLRSPPVTTVLPNEAYCQFQKEELTSDSMNECLQKLRCYEKGEQSVPLWYECLYNPECNQMRYKEQTSLKFSVQNEGRLIFLLKNKFNAGNTQTKIILDFQKRKVVFKVEGSESAQNDQRSIPRNEDEYKYLRGYEIKVQDDVFTSHDLGKSDKEHNTMFARKFNFKLHLIYVTFFGTNYEDRPMKVTFNCKPHWDKCFENPCLNQGECMNNTCRCSRAYMGDLCETSLCQNDSCKNGGTCQPWNDPPYFKCKCHSEYSGSTCEKIFDYCYSSPCQNGGTCSKKLGGFTCSCSKNYEGDTCTIRRNACSILKPCKNGGVCRSSDESSSMSYSCDCGKHYAGQNCSVSLAKNIKVFHQKKGVTLNDYPFTLTLESMGTFPLRCYMDTKTNHYFAATESDMKPADSTEIFNELSSLQYDLSNFNYKGQIFTQTFSHVYLEIGTYEISVQCYNQEYLVNGVSKPVQIRSQSHADILIPSVTIKNCGRTGKNAPKYKRKDPIQVDVIINSSGSKLKIDSILWTTHLSRKNNPFPTRLNEKIANNTGNDIHTIKIPSFSLDIGNHIVKVRVNLYSIRFGIISIYQLGWLSIIESNFVCVIRGGDSVSLPPELLIIDATDSYDPNELSGELRDIDIQWKCWYAGSLQSNQVCLGPKKSLPYKDLTLDLSGDRSDKLPSGKYEFEVQILSQDKNCSRRQIVTVSEPGSLIADIICIKNCNPLITPQEKMSMKASCRNCKSENYDVYWEVTTRDKSTSNSNFFINWESDTPFGPNYKQLIINPNIFSPSNIYDFSLTITKNSSSIKSKVSIKTNSKPENGTCDVSPRVGIATKTKFTMWCENWYDEHTPLHYIFKQNIGSGSSQIYKSLNPIAENVLLNLGNPKNEFKSSITIRIVDGLGLFTTVDVPISVTLPGDQESLALSQILNIFEKKSNGKDILENLIDQGDFSNALGITSSASSLLNYFSEDEDSEVLEYEFKRDLRSKLLKSIDGIPVNTIEAIEEIADTTQVIAGGHRQEFHPLSTKRLFEKNKELSVALLHEYTENPDMPQSKLEEVCGSILNSISATSYVASEKIEPPKLDPVDLFYPDEMRDYDVFDEEKITFLQEKSDVVEETSNLQKETLMNIYEALSRDMDTDGTPKEIKSKEISMWVQKVSTNNTKDYTTAGIRPNKLIGPEDSNYVILPNITGLLSSKNETNEVEISVTTMKKNPYWWRPESSKNVTTDIIDINLRGSPSGKTINISEGKQKFDIFLSRQSSDVSYTVAKAILIDWFETLDDRRNMPRDVDITNLKITVPAGGFSQIVKLTPDPQIALATDRGDKQIIYRVPVKFFIYYRPEEKASIHHMKHSFKLEKKRNQSTIPRNREFIRGRPVDSFTYIAKGDNHAKSPVDWYIGILLHPETGKRLLNKNVIGSKEGHRKSQHASSKRKSGRKSSKNFYKPTLTSISDIYGDIESADLVAKELCSNKMTYHLCERKRSVRINVTSFAARCIYWDEELKEYSNAGCEAGPLSTISVLHCQCDHLTLFAGSFLTIPNKIDKVIPINVGLTIRKNFLTILLFIFLLLVYLYGMVYARKQDRRDIKRRVIYSLDDNDLNHKYAYLITVYTGVRYKAGTTARVGIVLRGSEGQSKTHLLTGENKRHRCLERGSDSWFLLTTENSLGHLNRIRIWHDNSGASPEWQLDHVLVRDCQTDQVWMFLIGKWLHPVNGLQISCRPAALHQVVEWKRSLLHRAEQSLRDGHLWFSVFSRPLSSTFTRCQRLSCAMAMLSTNVMASLVLRGLPTGSGADQISRHSSFGIDFRDVVLTVESAIVVALMVTPIVLLFRNTKSREDTTRKTIFSRRQRRGLLFSGEPSKNDQKNDILEKESHEKASALSSVENTLSMNDSETSGNRDQFVVQNYRNVKGDNVPSSTDAYGKLPDEQKVRKLPYQFIYLSWTLVTVAIFGSLLVSAFYSIRMGQRKTYIWISSSGLSILQDIIVIQPLLIVISSWVMAAVWRKVPSVENRNINVQDFQSLSDIGDTYDKSINAKRTTAMYRPIPEGTLRKMRAKKQRNLLTQEAIKDISTFLLYILSLLVIVYGNKNPLSYLSVKTVEKLLVKGTFVETTVEKHPLEDVGSIHGIFEYLNVTFLNSLHREVLLNGSVVAYDGKTIIENLIMVGVPRLRQIRITNTCDDSIHFDWEKHKKCRRIFSPEYHDTTNYGQRWSGEPQLQTSAWKNEATEAWMHKSIEITETLSIGGNYAVYPGSGYVLHLARSSNASRKIIKYIKNTGWIDLQTRALFVELTLYNAESDLFNLVTILFEQNSFGSIVPSFKIRANSLFVNTNVNKFIMWIMAFYVFFILFNSVLELRKMKQISLKCYFVSIWNVIDFINVLFGYSCIALYVVRYIHVQKTLSIFRSTDANKFANFYMAVYWDYILTYVEALALLIALLKFWKILTFNKRMLTLSLTLKYAKPGLLNFFLIFLVTIGAFVMAADVLFAGKMIEYGSSVKSFFTLVLFAIGSFEAEEYLNVGNTGILFFSIYTFIVTINLINILLAIIMEGYEHATNNIQSLSTKYDVIDVFLWEVRHFFADSSSDSSDQEIAPTEAVLQQRQDRRRRRRAFRRLLCCCNSVENEAHTGRVGTDSNRRLSLAAEQQENIDAIAALNEPGHEPHRPPAPRSMRERRRSRYKSDAPFQAPMFLDSLDG